MALSASAHAAMRLVEDLSGKPVLAQADASLQLLATVRMARGTLPAHLILYKQSAATFADYLVTFQCGLMARVFSVPDPERFDVAATYWGRKEAGKLIAEHLKSPGSPNLSREARDSLRDQMYDGLIRQLRSAPIGLRVDDWIRQEYPDLMEQQRVSNARQLNENAMALGPEVRKFAPSQILNANLTMNAAIAEYWSRLWHDPAVTGPYRATGRLEDGLGLLKVFDSLPPSPTEDRQLIDMWGQHLGISRWFEFVEYKTT